MNNRTLLIACGALAHEITALINANGWTHLDVQCLHAKLHNDPSRIAPAVAEKIAEHKASYSRILVAYGDCGTGGQLDRLLEQEGIERLPGPHCYSFFSGADVFDKLAEDSLGTFYLTDYLALNFDRLILEELGINKHPELLPIYFGNYTRMMYLTQMPSDKHWTAAQQAASRLGLPLEIHDTGLEPFKGALESINIVVSQDNR